jgi:hypothetical protein
LTTAQVSYDSQTARHFSRATPTALKVAWTCDACKKQLEKLASAYERCIESI